METRATAASLANGIERIMGDSLENLLFLRPRAAYTGRGAEISRQGYRAWRGAASASASLRTCRIARGDGV